MGGIAIKTYRYKEYKISISLIHSVIDGPVNINGYYKIIKLVELDFCKLFEIKVDLFGDIKKALLIASYYR